MSINRFQLTQNRDQLIQNLEQHLDKLRQQRSQLLYSKTPTTTTTNYHRQIIQIEPPMSKYQLESSIKQNKAKLQQLQQKYKIKKKLENASYENTFQKNNKSKYINEQKETNKRKVIAEELKKAEVYIMQQKKTRKQIEKQQKQLYESIIQREKGTTISFKLKTILNKQKISLVDEEFILTTIFQSLKDSDSLINKSKLKDYFQYNPKVAEHFHITKRQLTGDLSVYQTKIKGELNYRQFFEFIKSIQITYRSLNPSKVNNIRTKQLKVSTISQSANRQDEKISNYNKYLSQLFSLLDTKRQKIVPRQVLAKSICTSNIKLKAYYDKLNKSMMREFQRRMERIPKLADEFYKELSLQYMSKPELLNQFKQFYYLYLNPQKQKKQEQSVKEQSNITQEQFEYRQQSLQEEDKQSQMSLMYLNKQDDYEVQSTDYQNLIHHKQLQKFDQFYNKVVKQNKEEIYNEKMDHQNIATQFNKLEMYIAHMDKKINP